MRPHANNILRAAGRALSRVGLVSIVSVLAFSGFGCKGVNEDIASLIQPFELNVWRVFDGTDSFRDIIDAYRRANPHITVNYRKLSFEEYEDELLNALAEGRGPDIMSLHNTWLPAWQTRLLAAPPSLKLSLREVKGTLKKEAVYSVITKPGPSLQSVKNDFVDGVFDDVVLLTPQSDPRLPPVPEVYGLPMALDTLVMYFNRDLLSNAGIAQPASDWKTFQEHVKLLTRLDETGAIIQSGAAIGGSVNVERSFDILSLLMMQNGAQMTDPNSGQAIFDRIPPEMTGRPEPPGAEALTFYTDFANPEKEVYTWNDLMPGSLQAFVNGQTAYFFGYSYHLNAIRNANEDLNFGIAAFPQIEGNNPVNYANYWVETVSKLTTHPDEAWDFVMFATRADNAQSFLKQTRKPTALRALVNTQLEDLDLSVFASQAPTAKNWYHGTNAQATEKAFLDMIRQTLSREAEPKRIVELAATKVNQTIK